MLGLEQALSVAVEAMIETGLLDWRGLADRMSVRPRGSGNWTDMVSLSRLAGRRTWSWWTRRARRRQPGELPRARNTPYADRNLPARVVATFLRGVPTVLDGKAQR